MGLGLQGLDSGVFLLEDFVGSEFLVVVQVSVLVLLFLGELFDGLGLTLWGIWLGFRGLFVLRVLMVFLVMVIVLLTFLLGLGESLWIMLLELLLGGFSDLRGSD